MDEHQYSAVPRNQTRKACSSCARIKCKCIPRADDSSCERCHRLKKECLPSNPVVRRGPKRHGASRTARLEDKLDDLVSLLRAQQSPSRSHRGESRADNDENSNSSLESREDALPTPTTTLTLTPASGEIYSDEPLPMEATDCLKRFREEMTSFSPYVYIPPHMTSLQLREAYPFLWLNIMSVASKSAKTRNSLNNQARDILVQKVVVGGERSLDLLLGILTYVSWIHLFPINRPFASLVSQLAVTLVWDLGLQMSPSENVSRFSPPIRILPILQQASRQERTIEERRAVLGTFVITSMASHILKAADGLRWSPYLDEYLSHLSQHSTVAQDKILIAQVKMQLILNQTHHSLWKNPNTELPLPYVDILQSQLDEIAGINGPFASETHPMILALYHFATLVIHESTTLNPPTLQNDPDLKRYKVYERSIQSIKAWLDNFFCMPPSMQFSMSCTCHWQLFYVVVCLHKISSSPTTKDPAWNAAAAREIVELYPTLDRIIHTFEQLRGATRFSSDGAEGEVLCCGVRKFQALKMAWQSESQAAAAARDKEHGATATVAHDAGIVTGGGGGSAEGSPGFPMSWFDDNLISDMLDFSWP